MVSHRCGQGSLHTRLESHPESHPLLGGTPTWVIPDSLTPLLLTTAPPVGKVISASTLCAMFHRAAESARLSPKHYTPHSVRCGGNSFYFQAGVPMEHFNKHGTWTSHAVNRYLFQHQEFETQVDQAFQAALTTQQP